jgi:hypothetical protein
LILTRASSLWRALKNDGSSSIESSSNKVSMSTSSDSYEAPFNEISSLDQKHSFCKSNASRASASFHAAEVGRETQAERGK